MVINLQLLGLRFPHRLAKKFDVKIDFPRFRELFGIPPIDFQKLLKRPTTF